MKAIVSASAPFDVPFYDLDPMNIVWHGNYAKYFELGRVVLLTRIGYGYEAMKASGYAWPVIDMHVRYYRPLILAQKAEVVAGITEWENRLKIDYLINDLETGKKITRGHSIHVAVDIETEEMQWETPPILREKLSPWLVS
ncbi:MAG: acyl-CoA thioesterase [Parvibaculum sp.]|nr:acyl-CoA thioesterase [Parvibaculum sp.]